MTIGTSDGEHFDDSFHQAVSEKSLYKDTPNQRVSKSFEDISLSPIVDPKNVWGFPKPTEDSQLASRPYSEGHTGDIDVLKRHEKSLERAPSTEGEYPITEDSPNLRKVLLSPKIQEAITNPRIDRSHDVPYEAGASAKPDDMTTHVDRRIPSSVSIDGKTFDPAIPANIHEQVEREVMERLIKQGYTDNKAYEIAHHEYAEPAEDMWYKHHGINIDKVNEWWSKQDKITEHENPKDPPPDLYKKPYPHNKVEGVKHEPTGVYAEWPTKTPP